MFKVDDMWENKEDMNGRNKVSPSRSPYHVALHLNEMQGRGRLRCRMMGRRSCHDVPILESDCRLCQLAGLPLQIQILQNLNVVLRMEILHAYILKEPNQWAEG